MLAMMEQYETSEEITTAIDSKKNTAIVKAFRDSSFVDLNSANEVFQLTHLDTPLFLQTFSFNQQIKLHARGNRNGKGNRNGNGINRIISDKTLENKKKSNMNAGDSLAVAFVRGDAVIAATGTVTTVIDDYILALGHPLHHYGKVELPLYTSESGS